jgi:hypothetical protein
MSNMKIISIVDAEIVTARNEMRANLVGVASALRVEISNLMTIALRLREDVDRLLKEHEREGVPPS